MGTWEASKTASLRAAEGHSISSVLKPGWVVLLALQNCGPLCQWVQTAWMDGGSARWARVVNGPKSSHLVVQINGHSIC